MATKKSKKKRKKLKSIPAIRRKLMTLWSLAVRSRDGFQCLLCGSGPNVVADEITGIRTTKCDAHHCLTRDAADSPLRYDIRNGVTLCSLHHKFCNTMSPHKAPIPFYDWLRVNRPEQYHFVLNNCELKVDLRNRHVLQEIQDRLIAKEPLNIEKLKQIEKEFPRKSRAKKETEIMEESESTEDSSFDD